MMNKVVIAVSISAGRPQESFDLQVQDRAWWDLSPQKEQKWALLSPCLEFLPQYLDLPILYLTQISCPSGDVRHP